MTINNITRLPVIGDPEGVYFVKHLTNSTYNGVYVKASNDVEAFKIANILENVYIVNNVIDGGTDKALSAEMGKYLFDNFAPKINYYTKSESDDRYAVKATTATTVDENLAALIANPQGDFSGLNFTNANFSGVTLLNTNLRGANLTGVSWEGVIIDGYVDLNGTSTDVDIISVLYNMNWNESTDGTTIINSDGVEYVVYTQLFFNIPNGYVIADGYNPTYVHYIAQSSYGIPVMPDDPHAISSNG